MRGKASMVKSGVTMLPLNFMKTGRIVFSERKTPLLNLMMPEPLELPPSGKTQILGNELSFSMVF